MGSHVKRKSCSFLLAALATILLVGLLSPPLLAGTSLDQKKIRTLELLGLDGQDPTIVTSAREANALYSIDVCPDAENVSVVLRLSGSPTYKSYLYEKERKLVVDLRNTVNVVSTSEFSLGEENVVRKVRNSQYRLSPSLMARVVLDLEENANPEIVADGNSLTITTPNSKPALVVEKSVKKPEPIQEARAEIDENHVVLWEAEPLEDDSSDNEDFPEEVVAVPAVEVDAETPDVEYMVAQTPDTWEFIADDSFIIESAPIDLESMPADIGPAETETENSSAVEEGNDPAVDPENETAPVEADVEKDETAEAVTAAETSVEEPAPVMDIQEDATESEPLIAMEKDSSSDVTDQEVIEIADSGEIDEQDDKAEEAVETAEIVDEAAVESEAPVTLAAALPEPEAEPVVVPAEIPEKVIEAVSGPDKTKEGEAPVMLAAALPEPEPEPVMVFDPVEVPGEQTGNEADPETIVLTELAPSLEQMNVETVVLQEEMPEEELITLTFRDADLSAVLDILARKGEFNILAGKDVRGVVTVRLVDVPLDIALNAILNVNGYGYIKSNNIVRILPLSQLGEEIETVTETYTLSYANASNIKKTLQGFLTQNGSIETDERTNMLIVTDVPGNMDRVRHLIPSMDRRVQQVLIEVLIVDSVLRDEADLGIQWTLLDTQDRSPDANDQNDSINVNVPLANNAISLSFGTLLGDFRLTAFIEALVNNTDSRILANPKILTLSNQPASIQIVQEFPYNDVTQTDSGGQLSNITFKEIGTKLDVKPQITHDEHVILEISPEQNFLAGETITGVPILDTRRAETTLIVRNHQTIVLGGLRLNTMVNRVTKVPILGDLPGVKYAFRSVSSDKDDSELLLFLTVHIVESAPLLPEQKIRFDELANMPRKPNGSIEFIR